MSHYFSVGGSRLRTVQPAAADKAPPDSFDRFVALANRAADCLAGVLGPLFWAVLIVLFLTAIVSPPR